MFYNGKEIYLKMLDVATKANDLQKTINLLPPGVYDYVRELLAKELKIQTDLFDVYSKENYHWTHRDDVSFSMNKEDLIILHNVFVHYENDYSLSEEQEKFYTKLKHYVEWSEPVSDTNNH